MSLKSRLENEEFAVLVEMEPPKGTEVSGMIADAIRVREKVDAFVVPDMRNGVMRMSALGGAIVLRDGGLEAAMQVTCRDRNRLALQADLLAAYACGVTTIILTDGGDPSLGDHQEAKAVYDLGPAELLDAVWNLQEGRDLAACELLGTPHFLVGSHAGVTGDGADLNLDMEGVRRELDRGVRFFVTPPIFDLASIDRFAKGAEGSNARILPTVLLLKSVGMARYISLNQANTYIPPSVIDRLQDCSHVGAECIHCAVKMVTALKERGFSGVMISACGWENRLPQLLSQVSIRSKDVSIV